MCFQNRFSRSDPQWKYGTKEIKGKTKVKNPNDEVRTVARDRRRKENMDGIKTTDWW